MRKAIESIKNMNILITGANSSIGRALLGKMKDFPVNMNIYKTFYSGNLIDNKSYKIDIRNFEQVKNLIESVKPEVVVHLAAFSNYMDCERNPNTAYDINVKGTENIVNSCKSGTKVIYISTDFVFCGEKGSYTENCTAKPATVYGKTKLLGERIVLQNIDNIILRISNIFSNNDGNFAKVLLENLKCRHPTNLFIDEYRNFILMENVVDFLVETILRKSYLNGIYHISGNERMSRFEFALRIAEKLNCNLCLLEKISIDSTEKMKNRPKDASMLNQKAKGIFNEKFLDFEKSLDIMLTGVIIK